MNLQWLPLIDASVTALAVLAIYLFARPVLALKVKISAFEARESGVHAAFLTRYNETTRAIQIITQAVTSLEKMASARESQLGDIERELKAFTETIRREQALIADRLNGLTMRIESETEAHAERGREMTTLLNDYSNRLTRVEERLSFLASGTAG